MVIDLLVNVCIVISFLFVSGYLFQNYEIGPAAPRLLRVRFGILSGIFGSMLLLSGIHLDSSALDLRGLSFVLAMLGGGPLAMIITVFIVLLVRFIMYGFYGYVLLTHIAIILGLLGIARWRRSTVLVRYVWMNVYIVMCISVNFYLATPDKPLLAEVYPSFLLFSVTAAVVAYRIMLYIDQVNAVVRRAKIEANFDYLTGLRNARRFQAHFDQAVQQSAVQREPLSVLVLDFDHFKQINDQWGHEAGDAVLREMAARIEGATRQTDVVARTGGEEFSVLLPNCPHEVALEVGERIRRAVAGQTVVLPNGKEQPVTVSVGAATYPTTARIAAELLRQADQALYAAKRNGRNQVYPRLVSALY